MRLRFIAQSADCTVFGHTFTKDQWVGDPGFTDDEIERLRGNPTFEVDDEKTARAMPTPAAPDPATAPTPAA